MDEQLPFQFEWDWLAPACPRKIYCTKLFEFRTGKQFRMGKKYGAVSFSLQILAQS